MMKCLVPKETVENIAWEVKLEYGKNIIKADFLIVNLSSESVMGKPSKQKLIFSGVSQAVTFWVQDLKSSDFVL